MANFDEETATPDELFEYFLPKYTSKNFLTSFLINNFYKRISIIIKSLESDDCILEVGCGIGMSSRRIKSMLFGQHYEISDIDARYLQKFREINLDIPFRQESVLALDRKDNEFDLIFMLEVMEHIVPFEQALNEIFRVSRKYVVISTPNEPLWRILKHGAWEVFENMGKYYWTC